MKRIVAVVVALTATVALGAQDKLGQAIVNTAATISGRSSNVCVGVNRTAMPTTALDGRKGLEIQNKSAANEWCGFEADAITSTGSLGRLIPPGEAWPMNAGDQVKVYCVAAAAQAAPNCTNVAETR